MITKESISRIKDIVFIVSSISFHHCRSDWKVKKRFISKHTLLYITEGKGTLTIDESTHLVESGKLFLLTPGQVIEAKADSIDPAQFYFITFLYLSLEEQLQEQVDITLSFGTEICVKNTSKVMTLLKQLYDQKSSENPLSQWRQRILFQDLMYTIVTDVHLQMESGDTSVVVDRVIKYMKENYMEELTIKALAKMFGLSSTNFSRIFKTYVGIKPIEYLTQLRIKRAKELLSTNQRLKVVAKSVGYNDELYFSRTFKKTVGVSPTVYVRSNHKRIVTLNSNLNDYLVTLEVLPVATLFYEGKSQVNGHLPYIATKMDETKIIGRNNQPNYEALVKVAPDLILNSAWLTRNTKDLSKIAPTLITGLEDNWKGLLLEFSRLMDKKEHANKWLYEFEKKAGRARSKLSKIMGPDETVMLLIATKIGYRIYGGKRQLGAILYNELGLTPPKGIDFNTHFEYTTLEHLQALNPDHIFLSTWATDSCEEELSYLKGSNVWSSLKAVEQNQVYEVEHWLNFHAPLKNSIAIDKTLEYMIKH